MRGVSVTMKLLEEVCLPTGLVWVMQGADTGGGDEATGQGSIVVHHHVRTEGGQVDTETVCLRGERIMDQFVAPPFPLSTLTSN